MGFKSTLFVSRDQAIDRIRFIQKLVEQSDFANLEHATYEEEEDLKSFVQYATMEDVSKWSNTMLEELLDKPFFRNAKFYNYIVVDELE